MGSSQSPSSTIMSEFEYDSPLQEIHIAEHFDPAFLQLQVAVMQPLTHLHEIMLSRSDGAGSLSVLIGTNPFVVAFQPQFVEISHFPTTSALGDMYGRNEIEQMHM